METLIRGEKVKITSAIKEYVEAKIGKLDKYFGDPTNIKAYVLAKIRSNEQSVEVTIPIKNVTLRAEEKNNDLYAAIDLVIDKLEGQIRKNKTRMLSRKHREKLIELNLDFDVEKNEKENKKIVKEKTIDAKPMSREEAILQMELTDHDFFVFKDERTLETTIVYKRKDNNYGIINTK